MVQRIQDSGGDCLGDVIKIFIKQRIVCVGIYKPGFHQDRRHFRPVQDDQVGAGLNSKVHKAHRLQLVIDIFRHLQLDPGEVVDQ